MSDAYLDHVRSDCGDTDGELLAALEDEFSDEVLTDEQAAKAAGIALSTFQRLVRERRGPMTLWHEDVVRWGQTLKAGEPGSRFRFR